VERRFALRAECRVLRELDGLGCGPNDKQQDVAVKDLLLNGGGFVVGKGGVG
jgi:hypothetical protein